MSRSAAQDEAAKIGLQSGVLRRLRGKDPRQLDFAITDAEPPRTRLVGHQRARAGDTPLTSELRPLSDVGFKRAMRDAVYSLTSELFERLSACLMLELGASCASVTGNRDEGGIDVYGRIPFRTMPADVPIGLASSPFAKGLLFVGQAKRYDPATVIGPGFMNEFDGAVRRCLTKYEGETAKPSMRVPEDFYTTNETTVRVFFTTASFRTRGEEAGRGNILVDGIGIAEFLIARQISIESQEGTVVINEAALAEWVRRRYERGSC
jgi:hypothetical protein